MRYFSFLLHKEDNLQSTVLKQTDIHVHCDFTCKDENKKNK